LNGYQLFRGATGLAVGAGVSKIVKTVIDNHVVPQTTFEKVLCGLGRFGIAMTASAVVSNHVKHEIDEYRDSYVEVKTKYKEALDSQK
jgi:hypothetical protein